ncbi:hypothetical protein [Novosphingobium rosa]|uniref:hypothetical protein n=1 Tax=Novosphingobium rosa TaxID=76978 RepID=UPI0008342B56|nr:hypothetical protein [Novosphingobium rosa]
MVTAAAAFGAAGDAQTSASKALTKASLPLAVNVFDPLDSDVRLGCYASYTDGQIYNNIAFNLTGYIKVQESQTYFRMYAPFNTSTDYWGVTSGMIVFLKADKTFHSGLNVTAESFTIPSGAEYAQISVPAAMWWSFQLWQTSATSSTGWKPSSNREPREWAHGFQLKSLRQTRMRAGNLIMGLVPTQQLVVNLLGDSYLQIASKTTTALANRAVARLGDAGGGWVGFGFLAGTGAGTGPWTAGNQPANLNGNARPALYPCRIYGNPTPAYYTENMCDCASLTLNPGDAVEIDFPAAPAISAIPLHWIGTGNGTLRYGFGATQGALPTSWTTQNVAGTAGTSALTNLSLTGLVQPGTLRIEGVTGTCKLGGVNLKSNAGGVRFNKIAATGGSWSGWAGLNQDQWQTSFADLGGHLTIIQDGRNSQAATTAALTRDAALKEIINRVRGKTTANPKPTMAMDVLIYTSCENSAAGRTVAISSYARMDRRRAYLARCAHMDGQVSIGWPDFPAEVAWDGPFPAMSNDGGGPAQSIHLAALWGGTIMAVDVLEVLIPNS